MKTEKRRKSDCIDDFLRKIFEMTIKMSSENTPFLNRYAFSIAYSLFALKKKTPLKSLTNQVYEKMCEKYSKRWENS
ncbi:MAG: hypothetical protein WC765_00500 [Phycisphaerae bacterium]